MDKTRKIIFLGFILISLIVIFYIHLDITIFNKAYYDHKHNGIIKRIESIVIMSPLFFSLMVKRNRIIGLFIGFIVGTITIVGVSLVYLLTGSELLFHIIAFIVFIYLFFVVEKFDKSTKESSLLTKD